MTMDEVPIADINALVAKNAQADATGYTLGWIREGVEMSGVIIPETRPSGMGVFRGPTPRLQTPDLGILRAWIDDLEQGNLSVDGQPLRFRFFGPAVPGSPQWTPGNADSLSISVQRDDNQPARIIVHKNGQTWEVTENDLDSLPADVRGEVERTLRGGQLPTDFLRALRPFRRQFRAHVRTARRPPRPTSIQ